MKVLLVTHGVKDPRTAVYRNTVTRADFLRQLGHDTQVLTPADLGSGYSRLMPLTYPFAVASFLLRHAPFDIVLFHSHTGWVYQLVRRLVPRHRGTRVAVAFHGVDVMYVRALAKELARGNRRLTTRFRLVHLHLLPLLSAWSCRRADRVFCLNREEEAFLLDHRWATPAHLSLMPHSIPPSKFTTVRRAPAGAVRVLTIAQWLPIKGTRYLAEAFAMLVRSGRDVTLTCAGTGKTAEEVLQEFPEDARARITVVPSFDPAELGGLFGEADVFVLASVFEAFGMVILEAMAAGMPIVATAVGGPKDILDAGSDALLVPASDSTALSAALDRLIGDAALRARLGDNAREKAQSFAFDRVMPRFAADLLGAEIASGAGAS